jgi:hypothetical protein
MNSVTALEQNQETRKVRAELNLEQWSIWQPSNSKNEAKPRTLRKEFLDENQNKISAQVEIPTTPRGTLTTEDQRTYYGLIKLWEESKIKLDDEIVFFSLKQLSKILGKKWGTRTIETLTDSLSRLYMTSFLWSESYYDAITKKRKQSVVGYRILDRLKIIKTKEDGHTTQAKGYYKFTDELLTNLKENYSKPVLLDVILNFNSDIAQILYTQLDRILSKDIKIFEKRTKELFDELGLEGIAYKQTANRKQILAKAIMELHKVPLSNGHQIASITLEKTADGTDYKLVVKRGRRTPQNSPQNQISAKVKANPTTTGNQAAQSRTEPSRPHQATKAEQEGDKLLIYFNQTFFGVENQTTPIRSNHRDLAASIVASYGYDKACYIIDFAKTEA